MTNTTDFHSFRHGVFDVTVLSDGPINLAGEIFAPEATATERSDIITRLHGADDLADAQSNIPLIVTGEHVILVDVGAGNRFQPSEGQLEKNLNSIGVNESDVTIVILSHGHPDHLWGLTREDGSLRFSNAEYYISAAEWDFWTGEQTSNAASEMKPFVDGARRELQAIAERVAFVNDGDEIVPGLRVLATPGHTPGHISLVLDSDVPLVVTVDAAASEIVSVEHPSWSFGFDMDKDQAAVTRRSLFDRAVEERAKLLGFHWTYPGVGRITKDGENYQFSAANEALQ